MRFVYAFDHEHARPPHELRALLGGKGAGLAEMASPLALPVPPGFTVTTEACRAYLDGRWPEGLDEQIAEHLAALEARTGRRLGDPDDPLLVSVRSGAAVSMPGMLDTVLDLGLHAGAVEGLAARTGDRRFAYDSYRRFVELFARVVLGVPAAVLDPVRGEALVAAGVDVEADLDADGQAALVASLLAAVEDHLGAPFPQDPRVQLGQAVRAVFDSWHTPRAIAYRRREHLSADMGTAVNVQVMVFGNRDDRSGTGVGFSRNPSTGAPEPYGDFLVRAQGEDVVAGTHTTMPLAAMADSFPDAHAALLEVFDRLERHVGDMVDVEFTIEQDRLWILQHRVGKRSGAAALRIAVDLLAEPAFGLTPAEALARVRPEHVEAVLHPQLAGTAQVIATGLAASPGAAVGRAYFDADRAADAADRGEEVVLVRQETSPEDVHGMAVAEGILTSRGGLVSHAAVVARGWGKPAVCGAETLTVGHDRFTTAEGVVVEEGTLISIDGGTGEVFLGAVALEDATVPGELEVVLGWADAIRSDRVGVRANADTGADAARARTFGAEGIGLCRTEHMFLGDRLPVVRRMILAEDPQAEAAALAELGRVQRADFAEVLAAMDGQVVTVRLLDPPLHEFLPDPAELAAAVAAGEGGPDGEALLAAARHWHEENPMLGVRGVRLAVVKEGLYRMQVAALLDAVADRIEAGGEPRVEVMVPLVVLGEELALARRWVEEEVAAAAERRGLALVVPVGTMIEAPRAALRAGELAEQAEFFSVGTNDLTQLTFGFSRDDLASLLERYLERDLLSVNPFETLDPDGVGELVSLAIERGRAARPGITIGVCGEHGGDPDSIRLLVAAGVDYVSCSPFRVPVARLAVAQALAAADAAANRAGGSGGR